MDDHDDQALAWLPWAAALMSLAACYGTLALVTVLSLVGITLPLNEGIWAGVIIAFAVMAVLGISISYSAHRNQNPARLAIIGATLVFWAVYGSENIRETLGVPPQVVEIAGFALLLGGAWWDWKLKRSRPAS